jgi:orotidine-5'-phosphate decarboxylase
MDDPATPVPAQSPASLQTGIARERLIVALDFPSGPAAVHFVDRLEGICQWFKVGLELYLAAGDAIVATLRERGYSVFLDLKIHDIPNTVAASIRSVASLGPKLLTIHASGGPVMLAAAAEAAASLPDPPQLLAVTVLTSMDQAQLTSTGVAGSPAEQVLRLAKLAYGNGVHGFVCSPEEAANLRACLPDCTLVTPGIRPAGSAIRDQKRIATPAAAIAAGANHLVVGRPITQAQNPARAAEIILEEIARS